MTASRHSGVLVHAVCLSFDVVIPITVVCSSCLCIPVVQFFFFLFFSLIASFVFVSWFVCLFFFET